MIRSIVRYCIVPKSPDEPLATRAHGDKMMRWTVRNDPDFPRGNRLGWEDVYYMLTEFSFVPGSILVEMRGPQNREWHIQVRHNRKMGDVLDAWCEWHGRILWLRHDVFHAAMTTEVSVPAEQMAMAELG